VVTGESGAGKTFGAVMAAARSADNAAVLYFSDFDGVCASAGYSLPVVGGHAGSHDEEEAFIDKVLDLVEQAVSNTLYQLKLPKEKSDRDGRRLVVVLDELGYRRDVLRVLVAMHADSGARRRCVASMSRSVQKRFRCGSVHFVAVGTSCDTKLWCFRGHADSFSAIAATAVSGREVFRGIIDAEAFRATARSADIRRCAGSICCLEGNHDTAPTSHAWSAFGHALVGNARVAALVARGIIDASDPAKTPRARDNGGTEKCHARIRRVKRPRYTLRI
jgi:hypothetical protein